MKSHDGWNSARYPIVRVISHRPTFRANSPTWCLLSIALAVVATLSIIFAESVPAAGSDQAQPALPTIDLLIDGNPMTVEVADNEQQRFMGLSFRESLPDNAGMLFVYDGERSLTFTMRNTLIPLSIAYISADMVINEIHDMDVGPGQLFDSRQKAQYALEVNQGWFENNGIAVGAKIVKQ